MMIIGIIINEGMNRSGANLWSDRYVYGVGCGDGFMGVICLHSHEVAYILIMYSFLYANDTFIKWFKKIK